MKKFFCRLPIYAAFFACISFIACIEDSQNEEGLGDVEFSFAIPVSKEESKVLKENEIHSALVSIENEAC